MPYQANIDGGAGGITDVNLVQVGGAGITLGQKLMAASVPVVIASNQSPVSTDRVWFLSSATDSVTVIGSLTTNAASPGPDNLGVLPAVASAAAPVYLPGVQVLLSTDLAGALRITGTVTANQGGAWTVTANQGGAWTVTAIQGGAPWSQNLTQVGGAALTLGQKLMAASVPVVIASDQSPIAVTGSLSASTSADVFSGPFVSFPTQVPGDAAYFAGQIGKNLTQTPSGRLRTDSQNADEYNNRLETSEVFDWFRLMLLELRALRVGIQTLVDYNSPSSGPPTQPITPSSGRILSTVTGDDEIDIYIAAQSMVDDLDNFA